MPAKPRPAYRMASPGALAALHQRVEALVAAHRFGDAIDVLKPLLATRKVKPALLHLMADLHWRNNDTVQAEAWFRRAIKAEPANLAPYLHLVEMFRSQEKWPEAERILRKAVKVVPGSALVHGHLGAVLQDQDRLPEAYEAMRRSAELDPDNPKIHNNLGVVYQRLGQPTRALAAFEHALSLQPDYAEASRNLARHWRAAGDRERAQAILSDLVNRSPKSFVDACELAGFWLEEGRNDEALALYQRFEGSTDPSVLSRLGSSLQEVGRIARGNEALRTALSLDPRSGIAWFHLVLAMDKEDLEEAIGVMRRVLKEERDNDLNREHLSFALGRAYERLKRPAEALRFLSQGNALRRRGYEYASERERQAFASIKDVFSRANAERWAGGGCDDGTPVFIVGMPRSGTTLVEQIIASHPDVFGAGELGLLSTLVAQQLAPHGGFPAGMTALSDAERLAMGRDYVAGLRQYSAEHRFVTDKMPHNFLRLGVIRSILPNAKIVHCRRDARDNCWSIYKQNFAGHHPYAHDLQELGEYHRMYQALMEHWRAVYPGQFLDVDYEVLVENPETQVRRMLEYCGLEWSDECLRFYEQERNIHTASKLQVRQPMYRSSVAAWEPFKDQLRPLLRVLEQAS
jgi:tetratricopeptide (TPR) repeat protein